MLPTDAEERKKIPMYHGLILYFPDALAAVAKVSHDGSVQHHPDQHVHWDRDKSADDKDALVRHLIEGDWVKVAWRALAALQKELELNEVVPKHPIPADLEGFLRSEGALYDYKVFCTSTFDPERREEWIGEMEDWDCIPGGERRWGGINDSWRKHCEAMSKKEDA